MGYYFTSESVSEGHPDKVADQISDAILDEILRKDPSSKVACETLVTTGLTVVAGEIRTNAYVEVPDVARRVITKIGYNKSEYQFDAQSCGVLSALHGQSNDIYMGVGREKPEEQGAGDQGMMFGYACNDTNQMLPKAMVILQELSKEYDKLVHSHEDFYPDGKAQITGIYDDDFNLESIKDFTISYNNSEKNRAVTDKILEDIARKLCAQYGIEVERFLINPTGRFLIGGFEGDAGLTGRKIVVDAYQSFANVGGGCMNGKDPTKVDLSGAYMARKYAKELLKKYDLKWCEVQLSYAIGLRRPLAIYIDSDKGNLVPEEQMYERGEPRHIIEELDLLHMCYEKQAMFGHFTD
jgi:S-adenosylmethionine synthetase